MFRGSWSIDMALLTDLSRILIPLETAENRRVRRSTDVDGALEPRCLRPRAPEGTKGYQKLPEFEFCGVAGAKRRSVITSGSNEPWPWLARVVTFCHPVLGARRERAYFNPKTEVGRAEGRRDFPSAFEQVHPSIHLCPPKATKSHLRPPGLKFCASVHPAVIACGFFTRPPGH